MVSSTASAGKLKPNQINNKIIIIPFFFEMSGRRSSHQKTDSSKESSMLVQNDIYVLTALVATGKHLLDH